MNKLLTIVIPTYNMQAYLGRCLDSLLIREDLLGLLEVLVVNDGSRDNSSEIAHGYSDRYPQTFRVIDKETGNYGSCVNRGLAEATAKYIKILDADDWYDTKELEQYVTKLEHVDADLILTGYNIVNELEHTFRSAYQPNLESLKMYDFQQLDYERIGVWVMHAVTYRVQLLRSINYRQTEGISYTDLEWTYLPLHAVKTVVYIDNVVYQYCVGREGQTMDTSVLVRSVWQHEPLAKRFIEHSASLPADERDNFSFRTLERQTEYIVDLMYKLCLVKQDASQFDHARLEAFDSYIQKHKPELYSALATRRIKPFVPIHYVKYWRKHKRRFPVDFLRNAFRKLKYSFTSK